MIMYSDEERFNKIKDRTVPIADPNYPDNLLKYLKEENTVDFLLLGYSEQKDEIIRNNCHDFPVFYIVPEDDMFCECIGRIWERNLNQKLPFKYSADLLTENWDKMMKTFKNKNLFKPEQIIRIGHNGLLNDQILTIIKDSL